MRHRRAPRTTPALPPSFGPLPAIALLIVTSCVDAAWGNSVRAASWMTAEEEQEQEEVVVDRKTPEWVEALIARNQMRKTERIEALIARIRMEPDDFESWTLLKDLDGDPNELVPVYRAALRASSPNLRIQAVRWLGRHQDADSLPAIEALWEGGLPDWARPDLVAALSNLIATASFDQEEEALAALRMGQDRFRPLTWHPDPDVRVAAIQAVGRLFDEESISRLQHLARQGDADERRAALEALGSWTWSDAAFDTVFEASQTEDPWRPAAIAVLGGFGRPEGDVYLLQLMGTADDLILRLQAAEALKLSSYPGVTDALLDLLSAPEMRMACWTTSTVVEVLRDRLDPEAIPRLRDLVADGGPHVSKYLNLIASLDDPDAPYKVARVEASRSFAPREPNAADTWHVAAPHGWRSIRCSHRPALSGESWLRDRLPNGSPITLLDRFERNGETWGLVESDAADECWVPMRDLERGPGDGPPDFNLEEPELDVPAEVLETRAVRRLIRMGAIEPFDPDDGVSGIVIHPDFGGVSLEELFETLGESGVWDGPEEEE